MPEGPSIVILNELVTQFNEYKVVEVVGNTKVDKVRLLNKKVSAFKSWGKHTLICFDDFTVRIHLLMFGSYLVNENKETSIRLGLKFTNGFVNFYNCSIKILEGNVNTIYDWSADVMNNDWNAKNAEFKINKNPNMMICDALLNQEIFAGVGNIIKNEVLYRIKVHPESLVGRLSKSKIKTIIKEARNYSFEFLKWKKEYVLKQHWLVYTKKICHRCNLPIIKKQTGIYKRRSFICINCQKLYN